MPTTWVARPQFLSTLSLRRATETPRRQPHSTQFLSTLSLRRATCYSLRHSTSRWYFYPRSPCGERHQLYDTYAKVLRVFLSTLSLRRATSSVNNADQEARFLSTLSLRRATAGAIGQLQCIHDFYPRSPCGERRWLRCWQLAARDISIHALLAESDVHYDNYNLHCVISIHALLAESDRFLLS